MYFFLDVDEQTPVACDFSVWLIFVDAPSHRIAIDEVGSTRIITSFTGYDPYYTPQVASMLYVTYLEDGPWGGEEMMYETLEEALMGHQKTLQLVQQLSEENTKEF